MGQPAAAPLLELRGITKRFGEKVANDTVSVQIHEGRVHAIVGENGAGKSTLMSMIAGTLQPDEGTIHHRGREVTIESPYRAHELGIGMVHQHFKLVPSLTVADNVFLGREKLRATRSIDTHAQVSAVTELSGRFGLDIDPEARIRDLSVGLRQRVEVLKALSHDTEVLILDEPTAVLTPAESHELFGVVRSLAAAGCAVVFISHKLGEVLAVADDITVVRDGRHVRTLPNEGVTEQDLASLMVGRDVLLRIAHTEATPGEPIVEITGLSYVDGRGVRVLDDLDITVRSGEIVGVAGVEGNGQSQLAEAIAGLLRPDSGQMFLGGRPLARTTVAERREAGLAYIPEDRHDVGAGPGMSVSDNILPMHENPPQVRAGWISLRKAGAFAQSLIKAFDVRGATHASPMRSLSGGNMQKVIIAREMTTDPQLLMVAQPTRGVDVGAMEFVHNAIVGERDKGVGVLLISADLNEVMSLSDRLLVMHRGRVVAEFTQETMSEDAVGLAMAGTVPTAEQIAEGRLRREEAAATSAEVAAVDIHDGGTESALAAPDLDAVEAGVTRAEVRTPLATRLRGMLTSALAPVVAVVLSLAVGAVIILALGESPLAAYNELFFWAFRSPQGIAALLAQFIPLLVIAAATIVSFRAGFFNIGAEGQMFIGAIAAAWVGVTLSTLPGPWLALLVIGGGILGGMIWGFIPGALLGYLRVDIIVTTLMLSEIAKLVTRYLITGPFRDPDAGFAGSAQIGEGGRLTMFSRPWGLGMDLVIALVVFVIIGLLLTRTTWGLHVRQLGEANRFAEYSGVNPRRMSVQVMCLSGAVAGLVGALLVMGPINSGRFVQTLSPGYGFLGITVALLARLNPWGALIAALFYANMMAGANAMQRVNVPFPLVDVIQGLIILMVTATFIVDRRTRRNILRMLPFGRRGQDGSTGTDPVPGGVAAGSGAVAAGSGAVTPGNGAAPVTGVRTDTPGDPGQPGGPSPSGAPPGDPGDPVGGRPTAHDARTGD